MKQDPVEIVEGVELRSLPVVGVGFHHEAAAVEEAADLAAVEAVGAAAGVVAEALRRMGSDSRRDPFDERGGLSE